MHFPLLRCTLTLLLLGSLASPAFSQNATGAINGTVTDPSGAVIPGATVTLTHDDTSTTTTKTTDASGEFTFEFLRSGTYSLLGRLCTFQCGSAGRQPIRIQIDRAALWAPVRARFELGAGN